MSAQLPKGMKTYAELTRKSSEINKKCTKCGLAGEFARNKNTPDGFHKWCKPCLSEGKKKSYLKKKEQYNLKSREGYLLNKDKYLRLNAEWRKNNADKMSGYIQKYRASEKGKAIRRLGNKRMYESGYTKAWGSAKRRGIKDATPSWIDKKQLVEIFKNRPKGFHVDHIVPLRGKTVCGLNVPWNLQYLPAHENCKKSNKLLTNKS